MALQGAAAQIEDSVLQAAQIKQVISEADVESVPRRFLSGRRRRNPGNHNASAVATSHYRIGTCL